MDTTTNKNEPYIVHQLYDSHVIGKEVSVADCCARALLPPTLQTQVDDEGVEWYDQDKADHGEDDEVDICSCGAQADVQEIRHI